MCGSFIGLIYHEIIFGYVSVIGLWSTNIAGHDIVLCFCFVCLFLVSCVSYVASFVSLDCSFLIVPSVFSNVYSLVRFLQTASVWYRR
jgi:hypothetical protein